MVDWHGPCMQHAISCALCCRAQCSATQRSAVQRCSDAALPVRVSCLVAGAGAGAIMACAPGSHSTGPSAQARPQALVAARPHVWRTRCRRPCASPPAPHPYSPTGPACSHVPPRAPVCPWLGPALPHCTCSDRGVVARWVAAAERVGFTALMVTVDAQRLGRREADERNRWAGGRAWHARRGGEGRRAGRCQAKHWGGVVPCRPCRVLPLPPYYTSLELLTTS